MTSTRTDTSAKATREPERLTYTLAAAAAASGLSIATLRRHEKAGRLSFHKVGGRTLVNATSLRALLGTDGDRSLSPAQNNALHIP
jgi:hypothetical protein